jgi:8-oxo-dGTP diphosphatase
MTEKFDFTMIVLKNDKYDGSIIDTTTIPKDIEEFEKDLLLILENLENKKLLWIKLMIEESSLISILTKHGFVFHHCNERDITLVKKLIQKPVIPTATNHTLGVGAVVIDNNKLLVIKDKIYQGYKLPGGHIDDSENITSALIREVYEETGINIKFDSIISLRHISPGQFNESNLYLVCRATALSNEINVIDTDEILEAKWMDVDTYLNLDDVHPFNKKIVKTALENEGFKIIDSENLIYRKDLNYEIFF